jgi:hypothetical protein
MLSSRSFLAAALFWRGPGPTIRLCGRRDVDNLAASWRMSRRSGHRFADKDMRKRMNLKHVPIPKERDML